MVELSPEQFETLERASGRLGPGGYVRAVALGLAEAGDALEQARSRYHRGLHGTRRSGHRWHI